MSSQGWIKLHRKLIESTIFSSEKGLKIWIWCLLKANHEGKDVFKGRHKIHILPGQFVTGRNTANEELKMAVGTIWFWLDQLEVDKYIERKSTNKYSVITVLNYNQYQETERTLNADRTQIEQQIEPNKNDKNEKNINILETQKVKSKQMTFIGDILNKKTGISTEWQDRAFRYAKELNIDLKQSDLKVRWLSLFKKGNSNRLQKAYAFLSDYIPFTSIQSAEDRIKYYFWYYGNKT